MNFVTHNNYDIQDCNNNNERWAPFFALIPVQYIVLMRSFDWNDSAERLIYMIEMYLWCQIQMIEMIWPKRQIQM